MPPLLSLNTLVFTSLALIAFAANSVLCRLALANNAIDAAGFSIVRLLSGIVILWLLLLTCQPKTSFTQARGSWFASSMLFIYAVSFSYAYILLDTATGALILFGSVQITLLLWSLVSGNRLSRSEWLGMGLAFAGFVYLILPDISTPSFPGFILMTLSGVAWGFYTLKGRQSQQPLVDTTFNFTRTLPWIIILTVVALTLKQIHYSPQGLLLAILSGALASGIGYAIWYKALTGLSATQAAVFQLLVPVIAALGGLFWVGESLTLRLALAAGMILGGILLVVLGKHSR